MAHKLETVSDSLGKTPFKKFFERKYKLHKVEIPSDLDRWNVPGINGLVKIVNLPREEFKKHLKGLLDQHEMWVDVYQKANGNDAVLDSQGKLSRIELALQSINEICINRESTERKKRNKRIVASVAKWIPRSIKYGIIGSTIGITGGAAIRVIPEMISASNRRIQLSDNYGGITTAIEAKEFAQAENLLERFAQNGGLKPENEVFLRKRLTSEIEQHARFKLREEEGRDFQAKYKKAMDENDFDAARTEIRDWYATGIPIISSDNSLFDLVDHLEINYFTDKIKTAMDSNEFSTAREIVDELKGKSIEDFKLITGLSDEVNNREAYNLTTEFNDSLESLDLDRAQDIVDELRDKGLYESAQSLRGNKNDIDLEQEILDRTERKIYGSFVQSSGAERIAAANKLLHYYPESPHAKEVFATKLVISSLNDLLSDVANSENLQTVSAQLGETSIFLDRFSDEITALNWSPIDNLCDMSESYVNSMKKSNGGKIRTTKPSERTTELPKAYTILRDRAISPGTNGEFISQNDNGIIKVAFASNHVNVDSFNEGANNLGLPTLKRYRHRSKEWRSGLPHYALDFHISEVVQITPPTDNIKAKTMRNRINSLCDRVKAIN